MKKNERLQALKILTTLIQDKIPLSHLMSADLSPLTKELCFGVCRHYFRLEALAHCLLAKKPKELVVWVSLLMGLYQLHYLEIADYAVVKETVALLEQIKKPWAKGLVNAVLRNYCRKQDALLNQLKNDAAFYYGHPDWLITQLQTNWPNDWEAILKANDTHPPMSLRVNSRRVSVPVYLERLKKVGIEAATLTHSPDGIILKKPCTVYDLPGFKEGDISVQDGAAQLAVSLLSLRPGLRLLDACAAPGGKTCHILEKEPALSTCVAIDIDEQRLNRIRENLTRLHLEAILLKANALNPESFWDAKPFDRILLDAPCSATGVIRRHPDIKLLRTAQEIREAAVLQQKLLEALWPLLAPGGLMVYATCSIMPEENEQQIANFIAHHQNCELAPQSISWGQFTGHGWQILPGENNMDGFFYSVLKKTC